MRIKIKKFKKVISTNNEAIKIIKKRNIKPTIIVANSQIKGRGTMGKKWISKKGNIFISIFYKVNFTNLKI